LHQRKPILILALLCLLIHLQPIVISAPTYVEVYPDIAFIPNNKGAVLFDSKAYFDVFTFESGYAYFTNFRFPSEYTWGNIGFNCEPGSANMTIVSTLQRKITYTVNAPNRVTSVTKVKTDYSYAPYQVDGADDFQFNNGILRVEIKHSSPETVIAYWSSSAPVSTGLLDGFKEDFIGSLIAEYTNTLGPVFWVFITLIFMVPLVNRIGVFPVVIIAGMWWATFLYILPAYALNMGMAIVLLAGASVLVVLFFTRRRQYA